MLIENEAAFEELRKTNSPPETFRVCETLKVWPCA